MLKNIPPKSILQRQRDFAARNPGYYTRRRRRVKEMMDAQVDAALKQHAIAAGVSPQDLAQHGLPASATESLASPPRPLTAEEFSRALLAA